MADLDASAPLAHLRPGSAALRHERDGLVIEEVTDLSAILLFDQPDDPGFTVNIERIIGAALPREPNTVAGGAVAWIAPGQWLVLGRTMDERLGVDVSDAYCTVRTKGHFARRLLSRGVPVDLESAAFAAGRCGRTLMGAIPITLVCEEGAYLVLVDRNLAHAAWTWLIDGAVDLGVV